MVFNRSSDSEPNIMVVDDAPPPWRVRGEGFRPGFSITISFVKQEEVKKAIQMCTRVQNINTLAQRNAHTS